MYPSKASHGSHSQQALFLPEASDYIASGPKESISLAQPMETSPFVLGLRKAAKDSVLAINVGIHVPAKDGKISNRSCWINEKGDVGAIYDKYAFPRASLSFLGQSFVSKLNVQSQLSNCNIDFTQASLV